MNSGENTRQLNAETPQSNAMPNSIGPDPTLFGTLFAHESWSDTPRQ